MIRLQAKNLSFSYPGKILFSDFSLTVKAGEWIAIIGNNGTGKTTLLKVLAGIVQPQSGQVLLGTPEQPLSPIERAYVGQHDFSRYGPFPATAMEIVMSAFTARLGLFKTPTKAMHSDAKAMLQSVGLGNELNARLADLSGGQQQRVFIDKALLLKP